MVDNQQSTRRNVLRKGAVAATILAGGTVASSGAGSASEPTSCDVLATTPGGEGDFMLLFIAGEEPTITGDPVEYSLTEVSNGEWLCTGTVNGEPNDPETPDNFMNIWIDDYGGMEHTDADENVNLRITEL